MEIKCPNCGNPRLMLILTETTETTHFISSDGKWMSKPVFNACGKITFHDMPEVLNSKLTLLCQYCGQENEAKISVKGPFPARLEIGRQISKGAAFTVDKETGDIIFE